MIKMLVLSLILSPWIFCNRFRAGRRDRRASGRLAGHQGASVLRAEMRIIDQATGSAKRTCLRTIPPAVGFCEREILNKLEFDTRGPTC
jgi:hypothetical protein